MTQSLSNLFSSGFSFMPHGQCYLWLPGLLWMHFWSDLLIGTAYVGISILLYVLVRKIRLPFSPVFVAFGLFIGLCGMTHFMAVWTIWNPDYWASGMVKAATAMASVATAIGLFFVKPQIEEVVHVARLSEDRRIRLESTNAELESLYARLKEADELKSQFFANVSHELRTPLALILGRVEQMLGDGSMGEEQRRRLESINYNGKVLLKQVNDLLDASRLDAGEMKLRYVQLDVAPRVRLIASQFEPAAEQRQIDYRVVAADQAAVDVDLDKFERILVNLLSNAFKFTPDGGQITVELADTGDAIELYVTDTGPGIDPSHRGVIFERFRQVDGGATRRHGGTGLGLAIVKDFAELHGGSVQLTTPTGGGSRFSVRLPKRAPDGALVEAPLAGVGAEAAASLQGAIVELAWPERAPATASESGRPTVLVVEDNAEMRGFVAETFDSDYNLVVAEDGRTGLAEAEALRPDLIVTDVMMPNMSGDQLVDALRARREFDTVPILLLTAKEDDALRVRLLEHGAQDYLTKPFLSQELRARAHNLLSAKRASDLLRADLASMAIDLETLAKEITVKNRQLQTALDTADVARQQAERASEVKSCFLGMISHELRTPLTTIKMNLQLFARDDRLGVPAALKPKLERLMRATDRMAALIEGLLEYTRVESGRIDVHLQEVDVLALAEELVEEHKAVPLPAGIDLDVDRPELALPVVRSDPQLLRVVINNLLSNALKYTAEGTIRLRPRHAADQLVVEVEDTGLGIPAEALERIFMPFEQLEPVARKSVPGVGLGLAVVKQIVEALRGRVEVTSSPGAGSNFRVVLPLLAPVAQVDQPGSVR